MDLHYVILKPVVSEKTTQEEAQGKYTFMVARKATKIDVKNAIKKLYGVNVTDVTMRPIQKKTRIVGRGREIAKRAAGKKATIKVETGKKIDIYKFSTPKKK